MLWPWVCTVACRQLWPRREFRGSGTLGEGIDGKLPLRVLRQVLQRDLGLPLSYHQMHDDETLEHNGPRRVAQTVRQGAKDLGDTRFARVCRYEDVFDILGLWGGQLRRS
jgi:hypothetical protein